MRKDLELMRMMHHHHSDLGHKDVAEVADVHRIHEEAERRDSQAAEKMSDNLVHITKLLNQIQDINLIEEQKNLTQQLNAKKAKAQELIAEVLGAVKEYVLSINTLLDLKNNARETMSNEAFRAEMYAKDSNRKRKHDLLIDAINIANRYLIRNFSALPEEDLEKFEEDEKKFSREVLPIKRIDLPRNGVCTDGVNLKNRKSITRWAQNIAEEIVDSGIKIGGS